MLYKKNDQPFSDELFSDPTCEYRGAPFWAWNCKLEKEELLRQVEILRQMGFGGFHMHVRTGMATDYLSPEYMDLIRACVDEAKEKKMLAWLYDEDRWPSGAAGGKVTRDEQYRARNLQFVPEEMPESTDPEKGRSTLLACYDVELNEDGTLKAYARVEKDAPVRGARWYAYLRISDCSPWYNGMTYVDTLNPAAMRRFLEVTHEVYAEKVGDEFGKTVPAIFTDEPAFSGKRALPTAFARTEARLPWTDDVPETFRAAYGEELMDYLPELFWELPDGKKSVIRYHYHDHIAERFAAAFADTVGKWCDEHGIMLTGHMLSEPTLSSQSAALGECMRSYRSFALPGIDMLCNSYEFSTAKQAQSAVHQYGREGMLSELYGVTGWDFDLRGHKLQGDWQAALGVTVRVPHLSWLSMNGEAKRDYPASINYQSPWYKEYPYIENHFARLNTALTRGKPMVRVGVVHPVESYWIHFGPNDCTADARRRMDERFLNLVKWLQFDHIDYDLISESLLPDLCPKGGAPLQVGAMAYDAIVVPGCETLRGTTLERLEAFAAEGGRLIFLGEAPTLIDARPGDRGAKLWEKSVHLAYEEEPLVAALEGVRFFDLRSATNGTRCRNFVHQIRRDGDALWLFLAPNHKPGTRDLSPAAALEMTLQGEFEPVLYDTLTGEKKPVAHRAENGRTKVYFESYEEDSFLFRLTEKKGSSLELARDERESRQIAVPDLVGYVRSEPNVLLLDQAEYALDDDREFAPTEEILRLETALRKRLSWPRRCNNVVQPYTIPDLPPEHKVRLRFRISSRVETPVKLALEGADAAYIRWNGEDVTCGPDGGWYVDRCIRTVPLGLVRKGENVLEIELPFGRRTDTEWCYLLGEFGVELQGRHACLTELPEQLGFDSVTMQRMPFYGGNITYRIPFASRGGEVFLRARHYRGAILKAVVDGKDAGYICTRPCEISLGCLPAGEHTVELTLFGNRQNAFGHLHNASRETSWIGPDAWRTTGDGWTYEYRLRELGLLSAPVITEK